MPQRTYNAPRTSSTRRNARSGAVAPRRIAPELLNRKPDGIYPAHRTELMPIAMASLVLVLLAFLVCAKNGWLLLYGDAVAHLGIARRILDARYPGLAQLGGVWLPLPHLLMLPFVQRMDWWQSGFAGALPSMAAYIAGNVGVYRLARRILPVNLAFVATAFLALNPNLLYLATTAMTEPLFLALFVWSTVITLEAAAALRDAKPQTAAARMIVGSLLTFAMVFTRYDGWIIGAAAWLVVAVSWWRSSVETRRATRNAFAVATLITVAGPLLWFLYNAKYEGDWLDFMRGPYSAEAIYKRTTKPTDGHYHGWHNPAYAFLYYTRAAQLDAAFWESGFLLLAGSLAGAWIIAKQRTQRIALLLWVPLPFYMYSIAWGYVPIFIPQLYPNAWYNSRYGMEMLPAFAIFGTVAVWRLATSLKQKDPAAEPTNHARLRLANALYPASLVLVVLNTFILFGTVGTFIQTVSHKTPPTWIGRPPLVFDEGVVNSRTRIPFEKSLAAEMLHAPAGSVIMFDTTDHIGAVQDAGIPLRQLVSPLDSQSFDAARQAPAQHANIVIALGGTGHTGDSKGDAVAAAVAAHPQGLSEIEILCQTGQPCARIYRSDVFTGATRGTP